MSAMVARSWSASIVRAGAWLVAAAAIATVVAFFLAPLAGSRHGFDDARLYTAAGRAFLRGADPYAGSNFRQWPAVAALSAPFALVPLPVALRIWGALTVGGVITGYGCLWRRLQRQRTRAGRWEGTWLLLTVCGPPSLLVIYFGQMSALCFAAWAVGLLLLDRRPRLAGVSFALIAAKPHLSLLALPALLTAAPSATVAFALGLLCWPAASILLLGFGRLVEFFVRLYAVRGAAAHYAMIPLSSVVPLRGVLSTIVQLGVLGAVLLFLGWCWWQRLQSGKGSSPEQVDAIMALVLAALPYVLLYDLLFVAPALLRLGQRPGWPGWLVLVAWWLLPAVAIVALPYGGGGIAGILPAGLALMTLWRTARRTESAAM